MGVFAELKQINCNDKTDKKKTGSKELTYLSWTYALDIAFSHREDTSYTIWRDPQTHLPYVYDELTGYMVFTSVTIDGITREMWLPVMDSHNAAMKSKPYEVVTKYSEYDVAACSMTDINKAIMRCLVKNLAMFGLGLYIYAGEDLPEDSESNVDYKKKFLEYIGAKKMDSEKVIKICELYGVTKLSEMTNEHCKDYLDRAEKRAKEKTNE